MPAPFRKSHPSPNASLRGDEHTHPTTHPSQPSLWQFVENQSQATNAMQQQLTRHNCHILCTTWRKSTPWCARTKQDEKEPEAEPRAKSPEPKTLSSKGPKSHEPIQVCPVSRRMRREGWVAPRWGGARIMGWENERERQRGATISKWEKQQRGMNWEWNTSWLLPVVKGASTRYDLMGISGYSLNKKDMFCTLLSFLSIFNSLKILFEGIKVFKTFLYCFSGSYLVRNSPQDKQQQ